MNCDFALHNQLVSHNSRTLHWHENCQHR